MDTEILGFKAGKLELEGKILKPDARKGYVRVVQSDEGLIRIEWRERSPEGDILAAAAELETVIFPDECTLEQIGTTRNYVLKFPSDKERNAFFWMQEPDPAADKIHAESFNRAINGGGMPGAPALIAVPSSPAPQAPQQSSSHMPQQRPVLAASLSSALAAALSSAAATPAPAAAALSAEQLAASLLSRMASSGQQQESSAAFAAAQRQALMAMSADQGPSLTEVLRPEVLTPMLSEIPEAVHRLAEYLPPEHRNEQGLVDTLSSHSFRQQLSSLGSAIQSGEVNLAQFGLQASGFSIADFLVAIDTAVSGERSSRGEGAAALRDSGKNGTEDSSKAAGDPMEQ
ncbi:hypothetical protein CEUSTIGMA_g11346.t1 [Chlamydomonas eustigma]|uniref:Uncharacterized protein n=1 Tax=Chlamydomonas eustigma TaxID=1157962 RepID=A0A250XM03_9CHLO|nr:hypothetical protein CEUSTIGMA_g11346.t1 [Chlamydomonas eustigma]|eukprot:GAX83922.1 hypothetical protein CEUSTIGMA_g11346.t1 [Chlamydomonas eustigma]